MAAPLYSYVLIFSESFGTAEEVRELLDGHPNVYNWYYCLPNAIFFVSDLTATQASDSFRASRLPKTGHFLILDTKTDRNGWLPKKAWEFMRKPRGVEQG